MHPRQAPLARLAAIYLICVPLAWALTPQGWPWEVVVAGCAVGLGAMMGLAPWWLAINAVFMPALSWGITLDVSPMWPLVGLAALLLVYGRIWHSRVPLFFSSARAQQALVKLIPPGPHAVLDVGCGDGRVLARLASLRPDCRLEGVEQALVPWLLARMRAWAGKQTYTVRRADLWRVDLAAYDIVYAYLSPAVMPDFWRKAQSEMRPGSTLVSAFAIPGAASAVEIDVGDTMRTRLHVLRIGSGRRTRAARGAALGRELHAAKAEAGREIHAAKDGTGRRTHAAHSTRRSCSGRGSPRKWRAA